MTIAEALLPEFDHEMASTRECLSRIPDDKLAWKAHEKSWDLRSIATHVANLPRWTVMTMAETSFDMEPVGGEAVREDAVETIEQALEMFDRHVAAARQAIADGSDADMMASWSLLKAGETVMAMPRVAVLRSFIMNHMIHHRGQLTVYLRLNEIAVPSIYGPSADEAG